MDSKPDILWLSLESVRADHTSLYDYHRDTTPHLESLSDRSDATVLTHGISASMWTPASTASILTGTHMSTHQVGRDGKAKRKLSQSLDTLPQLLANNGYRTALFSPNAYIGSETGLARGFEHSEWIPMAKSDFLGIDSVARDSWRCVLRRLVEHPTARPTRLKSEIASSNNCLLARRVERWFDEQYRDRDPFFAYAHIPSPHHTYRPIARFLNAYMNEIEMDANEARKLSERIYTDSDGIKRLMANGLELSDRQWRAIEALYDAEIKYADYTANEIIAAAQAKSDRQLVIIVTGDHGDLFGEYGLIGHNLVLHDGLIRIPMLVVGIDGIKDDDETLSQHIDVTYTIASIGDAMTDQFEGRDLRDPDRPYAISQRGIAHFDAYTKHNSAFDTSRFFKQPFTSVRTSDWKYLTNESRQVLYDLPNEETNKKDDYPEVVEELSEILLSENIDWAVDSQGEAVEFDEGTRDRLKDLGYLT